jgi:hypothetical protein
MMNVFNFKPVVSQPTDRLHNRRNSRLFDDGDPRLFLPSYFLDSSK